jgi:glycosyltransferase involved in cell wall biosynthesis
VRVEHSPRVGDENDLHLMTSRSTPPALTVSVIMPALNEQESITAVISAIPRSGEGYYVAEVLVIDGDSHDDTPALAAAAGAKVITEPRRGYGRACATGAACAQGDVLVFLDADGADDPTNMAQLIDLILTRRADMVLGSRLGGRIQHGAMPWHQRWGNWLCAGMINLLYHQRLTDLSPFRAVRAEKLAGLPMKEMTYGYPVEMIVKAARQKWGVDEVPVGYSPRLGGRSKISGTAKGSILAAYYILKVIIKHALRPL